MGKEYRIKFLSNFEFDNLPYKYVSNDDIGLADRKIRTAYVRKSGCSVVDSFIATHEVEHLLEKYGSTHDDLEGIAHKKGGAARFIVPALLSLVPGIGPILAGASNIGMDQYAKSQHPEQLGSPGKPLDIIGAGASGYFGGKALAGGVSGAIQGGTAAAPGFMAKAGGILSGIGKGAMAGSNGLQMVNPSVQSGANAASNMMGQSIFPGSAQKAAIAGASNPLTYAGSSGLATGLGAGLAGGTVSKLMGGSPNATGVNGSTVKVGTQAGSPQGTNVAQNLMGGSTTTPAGISGQMGGGLGVGTQTAQEAITKPSLLKSIFGNDWQKTIIGASIPLLGSSMTPSAQPFDPQQSQLFNEVTERVKSGAQVQLTPAQTQAITSQYDKGLEDARNNLIRYWKGIRPGSDIENDSQFKQAMLELESEVASSKANALAGATLSLSQQQTQMLSELAAYDINQLSQKAGISAQESQNFKKMLSDLGFLVAGQSVYTQ